MPRVAKDPIVPCTASGPYQRKLNFDVLKWDDITKFANLKTASLYSHELKYWLPPMYVHSNEVMERVLRRYEQHPIYVSYDGVMKANE